MLLVLCVDLDDDLDRKTGLSTFVVSRQHVEDAAVALATADSGDSDINVLLQGTQAHDELLESKDEEVEVAAVTGLEDSDVKASHAIDDEIGIVLASLSTGELVHVIVIADGIQDESILSIIYSHVSIGGVRRIVVRQARSPESMYCTMR